VKKRPIELHFPIAGIDRRLSYQTQPPYTTPYARNVRPESITEQRYRGGTRPGLAKAFTAQLSGTSNPVRMIATIKHVANNTLKTRVVASAGGSLYYELDNGTFSSAITGSIQSGNQVFAVDALQKLYIADWSASNTTIAPKVFDPAGGLSGLSDITASAGTVPTSCPCIAWFRGRLVLAGSYADPHQWYMSKVGDPTDWDYAATGEDDAVSGGTAEAYKLGEAITATIATSDNCLVFGCPTSLWILRGDPRAGGKIAQVSDTIGVVAYGAWCQTPENLIVFLSHDGLYAVGARCSDNVPESLSRERIPEELLNVDRTTKLVSLAYDTFSRGIHISITPTDGSTGSHWYFDWANRGFWEMTFPANLQPTVMHARRDFPASDSVVLMGGRDGYVRWFRRSQTADVNADNSTTAIATALDYGPLSQGRGFIDMGVDELTGILGASSGNVTWTLRGGPDAQTAYNESGANYRRTGTWVAGANHWSHPRLAHSDIFLRLSSASAVWSVEGIKLVTSARGMRRRRAS
jgi:hypothetical protein